LEIIGEKINGTRTCVARAIAERDANFVRDLARRQAEAGSAWLDVNAGTHPGQEPDDLVWLVENVQAVVGTPLCLDSASPQALAAAIEAVDKNPMINSSFINRAFLTLALAAGLDSFCAILDPLDRELRAALLAAELVLGRDDYCLNYTRAYRAGLFDGSGTKAGHE
jgi:hypothetical protein